MPVPFWLNRSVLIDPIKEYSECVELSKEVKGLYGCRQGVVTFEQVRKLGINSGQVAALCILKAYMRSRVDEGGDDKHDAMA